VVILVGKEEGKSGSVVLVVIPSKDYHRLSADLGTSGILVDLLEIVQIGLIQLGIDLLPPVAIDVIAFHDLH
jgi:hypothetical protein